MKDEKNDKRNHEQNKILEDGEKKTSEVLKKLLLKSIDKEKEFRKNKVQDI